MKFNKNHFILHFAGPKAHECKRFLLNKTEESKKPPLMACRKNPDDCMKHVAIYEEWERRVVAKDGEIKYIQLQRFCLFATQALELRYNWNKQLIATRGVSEKEVKCGRAQAANHSVKRDKNLIEWITNCLCDQTYKEKAMHSSSTEQ